MLNNNRSDETTLGVTAYTAEGVGTSIPDIHLVSRESRLIDFGPVLDAVGLSHHSLGFLKLNYDGIVMEVGAQLTLYASPNGTGIDSPRSLTVDFKTNRRSAAFAMPVDGRGQIALTNPTGNAVSGTLRCGTSTSLFEIEASGTYIHTFGSDTVSIDENWTANSCDIDFIGNTSDVRAFGFVAKADYAAPIRFYDPASATSSGITAVGLDPHSKTLAILHNTTLHALTIRPKLRASAETTGEDIDAPSQLLPAFSTIVLNLEPEIRRAITAGMKLVNLAVDTDAPNGALVGAVTQEDVRGIVEDVPLKTSNPAPYDRGSYPLRWADDYTNLVTIANTSEKALGYRALITAGSELYIFPKGLLQPHTTKVFDVDKLKRDRTPDVNGHFIPADATFGKFLWAELSNGRNSGLLGRQSLGSVNTKRKSSFSCGETCEQVIYYYPSFTPPPLNYGSTASVALTESYQSANIPFHYEQYAYSDFVGQNAPYVDSDTPYVSIASDPNNAYAFLESAIGAGQSTIHYTTVHQYFEYEPAAPECTILYEEYPDGQQADAKPTVMISTPSTTTITAGAVDSAGNAKQYTFTASGMPANGTYSWTVSGSGATLSNQTSATVSVVGTASTTPTLSVTYTVNTQTSTAATLQLTVLKANHIKVVADGQGGYANLISCPYTANGRVITYSILSGTTPITDAILLKENIATITNSCPGSVRTGSTPTSTLALSPYNGYQFDDAIVACPVSMFVTCGFTFTGQQWQQKNADGTYSSIGTVGTIVENNQSGATVNGNSASTVGTTY